jgi:streptogramin lyase/signal transduction histidine kinase
MWFGNPSRGVTILEPRSGLYRHLLPGSGPGPRLSGGSITAITGDASGNVWIASSSATIDRYDAMKGTVRPLRLPAAAHGQVSILALYRDREGTLWIGTEAAGIYRYDVGREAFTDRHVPAVPSAWSFLEDRRGDLWIGGWTSDSRLRRVNGRTGETVTYEDPALRSVRSMVEDPDGTLWLGSWGGGLSHLDPATGTVRNYRDTDGLPSNYVKGVLQDARGEVWMGTERGLCVLTPVTGAIRRYDVSDGLQGNFFYSGSCLRARDGRLFFGGTEGVNGFSPDSIHASVYTAPVLVTGVRVSGERERFLRGDGGADGIKVSYRENVLGFEFVALDYRSPARNRYAFMMEGFDAGWIDAGTRRYAMYTHLDPGTYVFKVRGSNSDGVWNPAPAALRLTVLPVYWQTWWFRGALVACAVGLLVGFYRYRVGRLLELERTRTAIATDLHDDIGTSLTTIALFSDLAKNDIALGTGDAVRRLEKIAQTSRSLLDSMNDIVWSIKPENDGLERTILRMEDYAVSLLEENGVDLHVQVPEQLRGLTLPMAVRRNLFLIFKEALGNILKHAGASAVEVRIATIELPQGGRGIRLSIRDNGKGFSQREGGQGNGLRNMNARARALGGGVDIESTPGAGTCVEVRVPLKSPV